MNKFVKILKDNRGLICAVVGVIGFGWTCFDVARQSFKVQKKVEEATKENPDIEPKEKLLIGVPDYIRPAVEFALCSALIIGGSIHDHKTIAGLSGMVAYGIHKYDEYRNANIAVNGKEADDRVFRKIASDKYVRGRITAEEDETLFFDDFSETFFVSTWEDVYLAWGHTNRNFHIFGCEALTEYYDFLGILDDSKADRYVDWGWDTYLLECLDGYNNIDIDYKEDVTPDGQKFYHIKFVVDPYSPEETMEGYIDCGC